MITEPELKELAEQLSKLTGYIADSGTDGELHDKDVQYACNVCDVLDWVLGEITTDHFLSSSYLDIRRLKHIAKAIEIRTQRSLNHVE